MNANQTHQPYENEQQGGELAYHSLANILPLMEGDAFDELVEDIRTHGVREPITLFEGQILDGRNRYRASQKAGIDCPIAEYDGKDPVGFVVSLNITRRHLQTHERATAAAKLANASWGGKRKSGQDGSSHLDSSERVVTNEQAAAALDVSKDTVRRARVVLEKGAPNVAEAMESGEVPVAVAAKVVQTVPQEVQATWVDVKSEARKVTDNGGQSGAKNDSISPTGKPDDKVMLRRLRAELKQARQEKAELAEQLKFEKLWHSQCAAKLGWALEWADELERRSGVLSDGNEEVEQARVLSIPIEEIHSRGNDAHYRHGCVIGPIDDARVLELVESVERGDPQPPIPVVRDWRSEDKKWLKVYVVLGDPHLFEAYKIAGKETVPCVLAAGLAGLRLEIQYAEQCVDAGDANNEHLRDAKNVRRNTKEELARRIRALRPVQ